MDVRVRFGRFGNLTMLMVGVLKPCFSGYKTDLESNNSDLESIYHFTLRTCFGDL